MTALTTMPMGMSAAVRTTAPATVTTTPGEMARPCRRWLARAGAPTMQLAMFAAAEVQTTRKTHPMTAMTAARTRYTLIDQRECSGQWSMVNRSLASPGFFSTEASQSAPAHTRCVFKARAMGTRASRRLRGRRQVGCNRRETGLARYCLLRPGDSHPSISARPSVFAGFASMPAAAQAPAAPSWQARQARQARQASHHR